MSITLHSLYSKPKPVYVIYTKTIAPSSQYLYHTSAYSASEAREQAQYLNNIGYIVQIIDNFE